MQCVPRGQLATDTHTHREYAVMFPHIRILYSEGDWTVLSVNDYTDWPDGGAVITGQLLITRQDVFDTAGPVFGAEVRKMVNFSKIEGP